jgi:PAS domain S-box-containing protein
MLELLYPSTFMETRSIQESLSQLYERADLGLVIADEERVIDANDAALRMFGYTREELKDGAVSWKELTPPEYAHLDARAVEQMRESGACVPFEKEFVLRDGSRFPFVIGAVVLSHQPMTWAAYILSLRENRRVAAMEQDARELKTKAKLANQLAHELNNPLAGLTFIVHLLKTRTELDSPEMNTLLASASQLVERISTSVQSVLAVTNTEGQ